MLPTAAVVFTVWCYMTCVSTYETQIVSKCTNGSSSGVGISLACPSNHWIHVTREVYGNRATDGICRVNITDGCTKILTDDTNGLVVNCNGKQNCTEYLNTTSHCNPSKPTFEISYECINDSVDMCSTVKMKSVNRYVYLHSPGFPHSVGMKGVCFCNFTRSASSVLLVELSTRYDVFSIRDINLETILSWDNRSSIYNRNVKNVYWYRKMSLNYDNEERNGENIWIKITAAFWRLEVMCGGGEAVSTTSSTLLPQSVTTEGRLTTSSKIETSGTTSLANALNVSVTNVYTSPGTVSYNPASTKPTISQDTTSDTETTNASIAITASAACGGFVVLLLAVLLVYFKVIRPSRLTRGAKSKNTDTPTDTQNVKDKVTCDHYENVTGANSTNVTENGGQQGSHDNITYSDLSRYENLDSVHEYGKLYVYGNTCRVQVSNQDTNTYIDPM